MPIQHQEGAVTKRTFPGPALYYVATVPATKPKATLALLHGYADHAARYQLIADAWAEEGIATIGIDMRGHGRAEGQRGYCERFDEYMDDVGELSRLVDERAGGGPAFLFGHSFGGLVALASLVKARRNWKGLVLSSPFFDVAMAVPTLKLWLGRAASLVAPRLALPNDLSGSLCTRDERRAREYDQDPLGFKTVTARWFSEAKAAQRRALETAPLLDLPVLAFSGSDDRIALTSAAREVYKGLGSKDKTWVDYPEMRHETWNEVGWEKVAASVAQWVCARA